MFAQASLKRYRRLVLLLCVLGLALGCGTAEYDRRLSANLAAIRNAPKPKAPLTAFGAYAKNSALAGGEVEIRVPTVFNMFLTAGVIDMTSKMPIAPYQLYPAGVKLPGYERTVAAQVKASDGSMWPYYMHFASVDAPPGSLDKLAQDLTASLKAAVPTTPDRWQDVELPTPDGKTLHAKKIRIEGELAFLDPDSGEQRFPGVVEIYLCEVGGHQVIVSGQCMQTYEQYSNLFNLLEVTVSTLRLPTALPAR